MSFVLERVLREYRLKGWHLNTRPNELNILGLRSPTRKGGKFDDEIHVFWQDATKKWHYLVVPATTDPSDFYLENPYNGKYTSILAEGQYRGAYEKGLHRGKTPALVQRGPVKVYTDYDRNAVFDTNNGTSKTGLFGINIHPAKAMDGSSNVVGKASAGCQVPQRDSDMDAILRLADRHIALYGNRFDYSLIDYRQIRARRRMNWLAAAGAAVATAAAALNPEWILGKDKE